MTEPPATTYPPIADYALIGDTRTLALVSRGGSVDWLCLPVFGSGSLFAALLDRLNGGLLSVAPVAAAEISRRYLGHSAVLETRFTTAGGVLRVTDFMPIAATGGDAPIQPQRELIRMLEVTEGEVEVAVRFEPRPDYGRDRPVIRKRGALGWSFGRGADLFVLRADLPLDGTSSGVLEGRVRLAAGDSRCISLSFTRRDIGVVPGLGAECRRKLDETCGWWRGWEAKHRLSGPFADASVRSLATLRQLSFSQSGAVIAAATTSLPEAIGGKRNWDYRYCWLRDAYFILEALTSSGYQSEAQGYFDWLMHATQLTAPELRVLYDIYGRTKVPEKSLGTLEGYRRSAPVRIGNAADGQLQLDVYGSVVRAALAFVRGGGSFGRSEASRLRSLGKVVMRQWTQPDNGIWELRGGRRHHTYSKLMCWAALDGLLKMADEGVMHCERRAIEQSRDAIRDAIETQGWNDRRGAYTGAFGTDDLDASVILMAKVGFIDPGAPRLRATFDRIEEELTRGPFVWRYAHGLDGFESREGAFVACSFWAAEYLALRGDTGRARERIETLLAAAGNDLALFSEEFDDEGREMLGNFPQALSHAAFVSAVLALEGATADARPLQVAGR